MIWITLAISAAFIWAIVNIIDKYLVAKHIKEPLVYIFIGGLLGFLTVFVIPFIDFRLPSIIIIFLSFLAGAIYIYAAFPYFNSLKFEEVSRIIALWQLVPIFVFFISFFTIGEDFSFNESLAFALLVFGGVLASLKFTGKKFHWSKAIGLMLFSSFLYAVYAVVLKYIFLQIDFWNGFVWINLGTVISALFLLIFPTFRKKLVFAYQNSNFKIKSLLIVDQIMAFSGKVLYSMAVFLASVTLVESLVSLQPILVFIISIILSLKFKNVLEEKLDFRNLLTRTSGILIVVIGLLFLYF